MRSETPRRPKSIESRISLHLQPPSRCDVTEIFCGIFAPERTLPGGSRVTLATLSLTKHGPAKDGFETRGKPRWRFADHGGVSPFGERRRFRQAQDFAQGLEPSRS